MSLPKEISAETMARLIKIDEIHGAQGPFLKKARIPRGTFKSLISKGFGKGDIVERVEAALKEEVKDVTVDAIMIAVAEEYGITTLDIKNATRDTVAAEARQAAAFIINKCTNLSLREIASAVGYKDHTGVINACVTISDRMDVDRDLRKKVWGLIAKIKR